jgi:hypothetical protein
VIDYIAQLPYAAQLEKTKVLGYLDLSANIIYEMQALPTDLAKVISIKNPPSPFVPVTLAFDSTQPINNPNNPYYHYADSDTNQITAVPNSQDDLRTDNLTYDPNAYKQDWKDLKRHFQSDLSKTDQQSDQGQQYLTEINSHL